MFLLLDNQDSFVHNLARTLRLAGADTRVLRSDAVTAQQVAQLQPTAIILSPGPHAPASAGCCLAVAHQLAGQIPMLGVCLGHQTIAAAAGATIDRCPPHHGMASMITHDGGGLFDGCPQQMPVGRYHSLHVVESSIASRFTIDAITGDGIVMSIRDEAAMQYGVQFHPESMLTDWGQRIIDNFVALVCPATLQPRGATGRWVS